MSRFFVIFFATIISLGILVTFCVCLMLLFSEHTQNRCGTISYVVENSTNTMYVKFDDSIKDELVKIYNKIDRNKVKGDKVCFKYYNNFHFIKVMYGCTTIVVSALLIAVYYLIKNKHIWNFN